MQDLKSYEAAKRRWIDEHPDATPAEYQAAMKRLAEKFVV